MINYLKLLFAVLSGLLFVSVFSSCSEEDQIEKKALPEEIIVSFSLPDDVTTRSSSVPDPLPADYKVTLYFYRNGMEVPVYYFTFDMLVGNIQTEFTASFNDFTIADFTDAHTIYAVAYNANISFPELTANLTEIEMEELVLGDCTQLIYSAKMADLDLSTTRKVLVPLVRTVGRVDLAVTDASDNAILQYTANVKIPSKTYLIERVSVVLPDGATDISVGLVPDAEGRSSSLIFEAPKEMKLDLEISGTSYTLQLNKGNTIYRNTIYDVRVKKVSTRSKLSKRSEIVTRSQVDEVKLGSGYYRYNITLYIE